MGSLEDRITKALADGAPDAGSLLYMMSYLRYRLWNRSPTMSLLLHQKSKARPAAVNELILEEGKEAIYDRIRVHGLAVPPDTLLESQWKAGLKNA